ncbi:hypothetical protein ACHAPO_010655 [Fusarium lateritium]
MEAIVAFAVAGNVLQFIEATKKFTIKAHDIIKSGSNALKDLKELRVTSLGLKVVLKELQQGQKQIPTGITSTAESEARISTLASSCIKVVDELLKKLDEIKIHDNGRRMETIMTAFRVMWNEKDISDLASRINKYREQLGIDVLISMRSHLIRSLDTQQAILSQLKTKGHDSTRDVTVSFGGTVINYVSSYVPVESREEEAIRLKSGIQDAIRRNPHFRDYGDIVKSDYPAYSISDSRREEAEKKFISDLRYREMDMREATIAEAYEDTFRWILQTDEVHRRDTKFREWLSSESQLYWITGKAGSGKSTLMKFLGRLDGDTHGSDLCRSYLKTWASSADQLVLASFYFWASGSSIVASQEGLFRALLVQLFKQNPHIIPKVATLEWEEYCIFNHYARFDTRDHQLQALLYEAVKALVQQEKAKVCFFIDGLDEYGGDPNKLISTIQNLLELGNIKICVSSRPWLVFEDAFLQAPNLLLQDYTRPDILHYVASQLNQNEGFARLQRRDPQYAGELIDNITTKSSGVFLWIRLVVNSLLAGLTYDDRISDLQRRLNLLPRDLEALYVAITESLDPFYFAHAAQYFKFMAACSSPPSALLFSLADEEGSNFALELPVKRFTKDEEEIRIDTTRRRINSRCKGLLEIGPGGNVQYLHRTVKDYLSGPDVQSRLDQAVGDYDCYLQHCSANLALIKGSLGKGRTISRPWLCFYVKSCIVAAAKVITDKSSMIRFLDCLDETIQRDLPGDESIHIHSLLPDQDDLSPWLESLYSTGFIALTARFGVVDYVRARASKGGMSIDTNPDHCDLVQYPLIDETVTKASFLKKLRSRRRSAAVITERPWPLLLNANFCRPPEPELYYCLVEMGADPVFVFDRSGATVWTEILATAIVDCRFGPTMKTAWEHWVPILQFLTSKGAKFDRRVMNLVMKRLYRTQTGYIDPERLYIALKLALTKQKELGLEYLQGEYDVRDFSRNGKERLLDVFEAMKGIWK